MDATSERVYSWALGEEVYLEAKTYALGSCDGASDRTGLLAAPSNSFIYVRPWLGWATRVNTLYTEGPNLEDRSDGSHTKLIP